MKTEFSSFNSIFTSILDKHAPKKIKFLRGNNQLFMTKELRKAIMKRSMLKNIARKSKDPEDWAAYRRQRNLVVNLNRHAKKTFFANSLPTSKSFWKKVKPLFSSKSSVGNERILLVENGDVVQDEELVAKIFNEYFNSITDSLNIPEIPSSQISDFTDPVSLAVARYFSHPSISKIKSMVSSAETFKLEPITRETMIKEIENLNPRKSVSGLISIKALKIAKYYCADILTACSIITL